MSTVDSGPVGSSGNIPDSRERSWIDHITLRRIHNTVILSLVVVILLIILIRGNSVRTPSIEDVALVATLLGNCSGGSTGLGDPYC